MAKAYKKVPKWKPKKTKGREIIMWFGSQKQIDHFNNIMAESYNNLIKVSNG